MVPHAPIRFSLLFYFLLLVLIAVNLVLVLELPLALAAVLPGMALVVSAVTWRSSGTYRALLTCVLIFGTIHLIAVALVLAIPAWQVIFDGASRSWAGRIAPLFVAALALHACNLWVWAINSGEHTDPIERLAQLFYGPSILASLITALILSTATVLGMELLAQSGEHMHGITRRFLERGVIPPLTVWLFFWGTLLLLGKWWNGWFLRRVMRHWHSLSQKMATPFFSNFELLLTPSNLEQNIQVLWRRHEESWLLPRYISWAVPILGFIGTVLGISLAADGIRRIIASDAGFANLSNDLDTAIAPLGIAFDTTLIALSLSLLLTLMLVLVQRGEERLLATLEKQMRDSTSGG